MQSPPESFYAPRQPDSTSAERVPPSVPDHELFQRIGSGAYGEVWLARNLATGALRAVKIVYRSTFADERPFNREFEGIKKFDAVSRSHPSQLALFHVGRNNAAAYFYYVMELADSIKVWRDVPSAPPGTPSALPATTYVAHTLRADLEQGRLPAVRVLEIALALTEALAHLHANGLIHRDVKPSNIIFVQGRPKLADIGLVTDASDTRSIVGTEGYLAPEGPGSAAADIFALGKVLYEMSSGLDRRRFPELPSDLRAWPDRREAIEINEIILKACAKDPACRYATAEAMLSDLKLLGAGKSVRQRRFLQSVLSWTWKTSALVALGVLALVVIKNELARRAALTLKSLPEWRQSVTTNQAAWQAWQRAWQMVNTYTSAGLSNAIQEWERATELDPNYYGAWSTLSITLTIAVSEGHLPGNNVLPRARFCAEKAIALNPKFGAAYGSLAQCNLAMNYDYAAAEPLFRKAIELDPDNPFTRINFAWELLFHNQLVEAEQFWKRLNREQPQRAQSYFGLGILAFLAGKEAEALALFNEGIRLAPDRPLWHSWRGDFLWAFNQRQAAAQDWLDQVELGGFYFLDRKTDSASLRQILNARGPDAFLDSLIALCEERQKAGQFVSGLDLARLHAHGGHVGKALDHLEIAIEEKRGMNLSVKVNPAFKILRDEPRFHEALRRLKLEK